MRKWGKTVYSNYLYDKHFIKVFDLSNKLTSRTWRAFAGLHDLGPWLVAAGVPSGFACTIPHTLQDAIFDSFHFTSCRTLKQN